jgi:carboxypeptidase family protein/PDZ domain-containing protein
MNTRRILVGACLLGAMLLASLGAALLSGARPSSPPHSSAPAALASPPVAPIAHDRTPEVRGHILDAAGNPVEAATVRLVSTRPPYRVYRDAKTDGGGAFSFAHVGPPRARVVADHGPDGVVTSAVLRFAEGQTTELTLVLSAAGAVRGMVIDTQDHPLAGVVLSVEGVPWTVSATSDRVGAFRLTTVPDGAPSVVAVARGYRTARASLGVRSDQSERVLRVVLTAADPVGGEVRDDQGNPVSARVVACEGEPSEVRTESAADGTFRLDPSAIGCDAVAEHAEYTPSHAAQVVEGGHLVLRLTAGGAIDGVVVDERGAALSPFAVGIESFSPARGSRFDGRGPRTFEDPGGAFRWDKLSPGTYVLTASAPGRPPARSGSIDVRSGLVTRGVRIEVSRGGTLAGHVYSEAHAPLDGADLHFDSVSSVVESKASTQTDRAGEFRIEGAPAGPFTVRVHKDGFRVKLVSGLRVDSGATLRRDVTLVPLEGGASMELGGIGAGLSQTPAGLVFQSVFADDPAAHAGLRAGDRVVRVDGEPTEGMSMADALQRIRGEPGTSVGVSVERSATGEIVDLTIVRGSVVH